MSTTTKPKKELSEAHKRKMQQGRERKKREEEKGAKKALRETIKRIEGAVVSATREDEKAYARHRKTPSDKNFNAWMRANTNLLNALTALKAHQAKLEREDNE